MSQPPVTLAEIKNLLVQSLSLSQEIQQQLIRIIAMDAATVSHLVTDLNRAIAALITAQSGQAAAEQAKTDAQNALSQLQAQDAALNDPALADAVNAAITAADAALPPETPPAAPAAS